MPEYIVLAVDDLETAADVMLAVGSLRNGTYKLPAGRYTLEAESTMELKLCLRVPEFNRVEIIDDVELLKRKETAGGEHVL